MSVHLSRNAAASVLQVLIGSLLLFILYRQVTLVLGVDRLGIWSVVLAAASASRLADLGLSASVTRFVSRDLANDQPHRAAEVVDTTAVTLMLLAGVFVLVLYLPLLAFLPHLFGPENAVEASDILPYALASLWLSLVSSVYQGGLDGCRRMDLRAALVIAGQILILAFALLLMPAYGLRGLAVAQLGQGIFLLIAGRALLRRQMSELRLVRHRWHARALREMWGYSANIQVSNAFIILLDPVTKALMVWFGGPASAGLFEMASQVVLRLRALIIAANQAIVPYVVALSHRPPGDITSLYRQNMRLLTYVTLPSFALLVSWGGLVSHLLIGQIDIEFFWLMSVVAASAVINIFAAPAYFINMGDGHVKWNTGSHIVMGVLNIGLGLLLGSRYGMYGVAVGYAIAFAAGSWFLIASFQKRYRLSVLTATFIEYRLLILASAVTVAIGVLLVSGLETDRSWILGLTAASNLILVAVAWMHPMRSETFARLLPLQGKR